MSTHLNPTNSIEQNPSLSSFSNKLTPQAAGGWVSKKSNYFGRVGSEQLNNKECQFRLASWSSALHSSVLEISAPGSDLVSVNYKKAETSTSTTRHTLLSSSLVATQ